MNSNSDPASKRMKKSVVKKLFFSLLITVLVLALLEGLVSGVRIIIALSNLYINSPQVAELKEESHCEYDSEIGWINTPNTHIKDFYGPGASIRINEDGVRGLNNHVGENHEKYRLICLGDSFTLGYGVDDRQTYPYLLEQSLPDQLDVVNMGQGGYSIGQDYLWLKRLGPKLKPNLVVCILITEDFRRLATTRTANGYATPKFDWDGENVVVSNIPVPAKLMYGNSLVTGKETLDRIRQHSALVDSASLLVSNEAVQDDSYNFLLGMSILDEIKQLCVEWNCQMAFVLTPTISEVFFDESIVQYQKSSRMLKKYCDNRGIPFLDLQPDFLERGANAEALFLDEQFRHYSESGNRLVANNLAAWLPKIVPSYPDFSEK